VHFAEHEYTQYECFYAQYEQRIAHDKVRLDVLESGDAEGEVIVVCYEHANKKRPTGLSGLVMMSEKEVYSREQYLPVAYLRKGMVVLIRAKSQQ
jgi:hypothetical protein